MMTIPLLYFLFSFLTYQVSYSKNMNFFRRNAEFIFALAFKPYFAELIFAIDLSKAIF